MKALIVLAIVAGVVFLLASGCSVQFYSSHSGSTASAAVTDVFAVRDATAGTHADEAANGVYLVLDRAVRMGDGPGAALIRQRVPALAAAAVSEMDLVRQRLAAVHLHTSTGTNCRAALIRLASRVQWVFRTFGTDVEAGGSTWREVDRFDSGLKTMVRSYSSDLAPCLAAAPAEDRDAIERAMRLY